MKHLFRSSIRDTLINASRHGYYARHWGVHVCLGLEAATTDECRALLDVLPPTPKDAIRTEIHPKVLAGDAIVVIGHTTGTTGTPHKWYLTASEQRAWSEIDKASRPASPHPHAPTRLGVRIFPSCHGVPNPRFQAGDPLYFFDCSIRDDAAFKALVHLLLDAHDIEGFAPRVTSLRAPPRILATLTEALIQLGVAQEDLKVNHIEVYGGYCNAPYRQLFKTFWGKAALTDCYSTSEIVGGGGKCSSCGFIYFPPHIHPQVLEFGTGRVLKEGIGNLCLTSLLPFNSAQPLVKYMNGDIAEVLSEESACCELHRGGLRVLGRRSTSVFLHEGSKEELLLSSNDVHDVFFDSRVAKVRTALDNLSSLPATGLHGLPRVSVPGRVEVGQRLNIEYQPSCVDSDSGGFEARLLSASRHLAKRVSTGQVSLRVQASPRVDSALSK